jgi:hypothetical protein
MLPIQLSGGTVRVDHGDAVWLSVVDPDARTVSHIELTPLAIQLLIAALVTARREVHGLPSGPSWWAT